MPVRGRAMKSLGNWKGPSKSICVRLLLQRGKSWMGEGVTKWMAGGGQNRLNWNSKLLFTPVSRTRYGTSRCILSVLSKCCQPHSIQAERMAENLRGSPNFTAGKQNWSLNSGVSLAQSHVLPSWLVDGAEIKESLREEGDTCAVLLRRKE